MKLRKHMPQLPASAPIDVNLAEEIHLEDVDLKTSASKMSEKAMQVEKEMETYDRKSIRTRLIIIVELCAAVVVGIVGSFGIFFLSPHEIETGYPMLSYRLISITPFFVIITAAILLLISVGLYISYRKKRVMLSRKIASQYYAQVLKRIALAKQDDKLPE